ncbi:MAG: DUF3750 domain-containing protein [Planctomycetota bacterium]
MKRAWPLLALALCACQATRPSSLREPIGDAPAVLVKRLRIPDTEAWYTRFASHSWFAVRSKPDGTWRRIEIVGPSSGVEDVPIDADAAFADERWDRPVEVLAAYTGRDAAVMANEVRLLAETYDDSTYRAWPGPNSNTFVERILRQVDGLAAQLDHNAVGKDWALPGRIGWTGSGAGVELELPLVGLQLGLLEGVEVHLFGLTLGVGIWPLGLKLPFLPALELVEAPRLSYGWSPAVDSQPAPDSDE